MEILNTHNKSVEKKELTKFILDYIQENLQEEIYRCQRYGVHLGIQLFKSNSLLEGFEQVIKNTLRLTDKYVFFAFKNHFYLLIMYPHSTYLGCDKVSQKIFHLLSESKKIKISSSFSMLEGNELRQVINGILSGIDLVFNLEGNHITHYSCEDRKGNAFFS